VQRSTGTDNAQRVDNNGAAPITSANAFAPSLAEPGNTPAAAPASCALTIRASHPEATIWVDGVKAGAAPQTITRACNATAAVEVRHPRYADFKRQITLDGNATIDAVLEREQTELTLWSEPEGADVIYDGKLIGKTPLVTQVNRFEQGHLYFKLDGYETDWRRIVPRDAKKTVAITLKKLR
jgi:hypothetical protein